MTDATEPGSAHFDHSIPTAKAWDAIVVGAGVFGIWTAVQLQRVGKRVLLVDGRGAANSRASSGGETRLIRSDYGADAIYTEMALSSLEDWKRVSADADLPLFHNAGVLFLFQEMVDYARGSIETHRALGLPLTQRDTGDLRRAFPQIDFSGVAFGLYEPDFGVLMARRSLIHLAQAFERAGGSYRQAQAKAPEPDGHSLKVGAETERAGAIIYACGPWMATLFPDILVRRLFVTRQEIAFVAPPAGDTAYSLGNLPVWADYNGGNLFYGTPDIEGRGLKIACDKHGPAIDLDADDRRTPDSTFELLRRYLEGRFPGLRGAPFVGDRVCQYTNSSNGDFLIDRHPEYENVILVGAGSGHGFKHGPEIGRLVSALALDPSAKVNPRFGLASKGTVQRRTVL